MRILALLHLLGNAVLLALAYYWLGLGESTPGVLFWGGLVLLSVWCGALWLHGTALVYFRRERNGNASFRLAARISIQHLPPLFVLSLLALTMYLALDYLGSHFSHEAFVIGSYATMRTRKPVPPQTVMRWYQIALTLVRWVVMPVLLSPLAGGIASNGWTGFRVASLSRSRSLFFWLETGLLLFIALSLPIRLMAWIPHFSSFPLQLVSFCVRFGIGYLLFVAGLLALAFCTSGGRPRPIQPSTVASP